jgi:tRNA threonylcarbamoyl adenosine modification protein YjeE
MKKYKVKICGTTSVESAKMAVDAGADYLGVLVNVGISERSLNIEQAKIVAESSNIPVMTLLYNMSVDDISHVVDEIKPHGVHLLGNTPVENVYELKKRLDCQIWLTVYLPVKGQGEIDVEGIKELMRSYESAGADVIVIDTVSLGRFGGTGKTADWDIAKDFIEFVQIPVFLAGGINPENVREAIIKVDPYGVDLASGVESSKCNRDPEKVKKLMNEVKKTEDEINYTINIISKSPERTRNLGRQIGKMAFAGMVIALCGDLGSGKTAFTQGLAEGLEVKSFVTSPTFVIVNQYNGRLALYHIDTYRLRSSEDMFELGYEEFFYGDGVTAIEWAQKVEELLPEEYLRVELEYVSESERQITIKPYGQRYVDIVKQIKS